MSELSVLLQWVFGAFMVVATVFLLVMLVDIIRGWRR